MTQPNNFQLYGIKYSYQIRMILARSMWPIHETHTLDQSELVSNGN